MNAKNILDFIFEMGLCEVFSKFHDVDKNNRDGTLECGTEWIDHVLVSERTLNVVEVIELIECE